MPVITGKRAALRRPSHRRGHGGGTCRRYGFTLIEALMACGILLVVVVAVTSAVTAGQQHAYHAQQRIAGTLAAEEWMGRLEVLDYHALTPMHQVENVGAMLDAQGQAFPQSFQGVGREAWVTPTYIAIASPNVQINGKTIRVRAFDAADQTLADISRFVVEPQADTLSEEDAEALEGSSGGLLKGLGGLLGGLGFK